MKLKQYLTEEIATYPEILTTLKKDCQPYLREIKGAKDFPVRGVKDSRGDIFKKKLRTDRKPVDTPLSIHNMLDDMFKKYHGWKVRSEGLFVWSNSHFAKTSGGDWNYHVVFPIGNYDYIYSLDVPDLFTLLYDTVEKERGRRPTRSNIEKAFDEDIQKIVEQTIKASYKKTGLKNLTSKPDSREIIFRMPTYYMVHIRHLPQLKKDLL